MKRPLLILIIIAVIVTGLWWGIIRYNSYYPQAEKETRFMMGTYVTIYAAGSKELTSKAISLAFGRLQEIDVKFSWFNPKSQVYVFNHKAAPISDPEILGLIRVALKVSDETGGAFDITVGPLLELWGFYQNAFRVPTDQEIRDCLKKIGYRHLHINNGRLEKDNNEIMIDLGGIAKGYALIEAAKVLKANGVNSAIIDAGGDIYALGRKDLGLWKIGIANPRAKDWKSLLGIVEVTDAAVMGSGDYERFFIQNGKRYHHIFNPKTGYPTQGVAGVTIIYPDPIVAQAWSKIPFVLGAKKGLEMLKKIPGMEVIIVTDTGGILCSPGMNQRFKAIAGN